MMEKCGPCTGKSGAPEVFDLEGASEFGVWLNNRLQEQRMEVLMHLEGLHLRLASQIVEQEGNIRTLAPDTVTTVLERPAPGDTESRRPPPDPPDQPTMFAVVPDIDKVDENADAAEDVSSADREANKSDAVLEVHDDDNDLSFKGNKSSLVSAQSGFHIEYDFASASVFDLIRDKQFGNSRTGHTFEMFWSMVILANALVMAVKAQYDGLQAGYDLSMPTYTKTQEDAWPGGDLAFEVLEKMFTIMFTLELIARLCIFKFKFFGDPWFYFDTVIVIFAWIIFLQGDLGMNVTFVRLLRLSKMLRLVKLMKQSDVFDSLKVLVASIKASVSTLFWALLVLLLIQCISALFMTQVLESFLLDKEGDLVVQRRVFRYFGTFWRAMITMFEITFANWTPSCRLLVDNVAETYGVFYLVYRCVIGFAVLMVVQAVFIQQTMKTTQLDDEFLANQEHKAKEKTIRRLERLFKRMDTDQDGALHFEEIQIALEKTEIQDLFALVDLDVHDFRSLFKILDHGDGQISIEDFVKGVEHVKGTARELDMMQCLQSLTKIERKLERLDLTPGAMTPAATDKTTIASPP